MGECSQRYAISQRTWWWHPSHPIKVNKTMAIVLDRNHGCNSNSESTCNVQLVRIAAAGRCSSRQVPPSPCPPFNNGRPQTSPGHQDWSCLWKNPPTPPPQVFLATPSLRPCPLNVAIKAGNRLERKPDGLGDHPRDIGPQPSSPFVWMV